MEAAPPLVWIDLEMSGLEPDTCEILEIATLVTDGQQSLFNTNLFSTIIIHPAEQLTADGKSLNAVHVNRGYLRMEGCDVAASHDGVRVVTWGSAYTRRSLAIRTRGGACG